MKVLAMHLVKLLGILVFTAVVMPMGGAAAELTNSNLPATTNLSIHTFKVDPNLFYQALDVFPTNAIRATNNYSGVGGVHKAEMSGSEEAVSMAAKTFFSSLGADLTVPGKSIFFNDRVGKLFVRATDQDLDTVERAIQMLNMTALLIRIESYYFEAPKGTVAGFGNALNLTNARADVFTGILNEKAARIVLNSLRSRKDVKILFDPMVTVKSGCEASLMPLTRTSTNIVTPKTPATAFDYVGYVNSFGWKVETNLVLSIVSTILPDGCAISLKIIPSEAGFYAHGKPSGGHFTTLNLLDNQTVAWGGLEKNFIPDNNGVTREPDNDKELLVFITATIVDSAGNRIHSDQDMPFTRKAIPPQPEQPK